MAFEKCTMENLGMNFYKFWNKKKVLLTGHTGFKGSWLLIWLLQMGATVYGYSLKESSDSLFKKIFKNIENKFSHREGNILDYENLEKYICDCKPDVIIHLAAQPLVIESYKSPILTWETNLIPQM